MIIDDLIKKYEKKYTLYYPDGYNNKIIYKPKRIISQWDMLNDLIEQKNEIYKYAKEVFYNNNLFLNGNAISNRWITKYASEWRNIKNYERFYKR